MGGYRNATGRKRESPGAVRAHTVQGTSLPRGRGEGKSQALSLRTRPEDSPREIHFYLGSWQLCLFFYSEGEQTSFLLLPNATEAACASACRSLTPTTQTSSAHQSRAAEAAAEPGSDLQHSPGEALLDTPHILRSTHTHPPRKKTSNQVLRKHRESFPPAVLQISYSRVSSGPSVLESSHSD